MAHSYIDVEAVVVPHPDTDPTHIKDAEMEMQNQLNFIVLAIAEAPNVPDSVSGENPSSSSWSVTQDDHTLILVANLPFTLTLVGHLAIGNILAKQAKSVFRILNRMHTPEHEGNLLAAISAAFTHA